MNVFSKIAVGLSLGLCMMGCAAETQEPPVEEKAPPVAVDTNETVAPKVMNMACYKACRTNTDTGNGEAYFCGCACGGSCIWY